MNTPTFSELCSEYTNVIERIGRLESLPDSYFGAEEVYELEHLREREIALRGQMKAHLEQPK